MSACDSVCAIADVWPVATQPVPVTALVPVVVELASASTMLNVPLVVIEWSTASQTHESVAPRHVGESARPRDTPLLFQSDPDRMEFRTCPACQASVLEDDVEDCPFCGASMSGKPAAKPKPTATAPAKAGATAATRPNAGARPAGTKTAAWYNVAYIRAEAGDRAGAAEICRRLLEEGGMATVYTDATKALLASVEPK